MNNNSKIGLGVGMFVVMAMIAVAGYGMGQNTRLTLSDSYENSAAALKSPSPEKNTIPEQPPTKAELFDTTQYATLITAPCQSHPLTQIHIRAPLTSPTNGWIAGQQATVIWNTCGIPSNASDLNVSIVFDSGKYGGFDSYGFANSPNDGIETVTIPPFIEKGNYFLSLYLYGTINNTVKLLALAHTDALHFVNDGCTATSPANIRILSPNGNTITSTGATVGAVIWNECNLPSRSQKYITLKNQTTGAETVLNLNTALGVNTYNNEGGINFNLPYSAFGIIPGKYKVVVKVLNSNFITGPTTYLQDESDAPFLIQ
jgi:hypothetical protein